MYYLGFDIGGSSIKAVLVESRQLIKPVFDKSPQKLEGMAMVWERKIIKSATEQSPGSLEKLLEAVTKIFSELGASLDFKEIGGIGFGIAGALDVKREKMLNSPNIQYLNGQPLKKLFEEKFGSCPIKLEHDVVCFLLAEKELGLAKGFKNVVFLTIGTGVGGAWMTDGKIQLGVHGAAGEFGHMVIEAGSRLDFEDLTANEFVKRKIGVGAAEAEKMARAGDEKALEVFRERGKNLGISLANIINIFDPEAIILGGGANSAKDLLLPFIQEEINQLVLSPSAKHAPILFSEQGVYAGALGAAMLFEQN
ncbi:ROK family protein [Patescibacteria group bacterium]|nr:ROK family protein [Patescibacteria group bacterium]